MELVGKWPWMFPLEGDSLWPEVIKTIHGVLMAGMLRSLGASTRRPWQAVINHKDALPES